jgi:nucleoside-diphosphate-sugar epimerase
MMSSLLGLMQRALRQAGSGSELTDHLLLHDDSSKHSADIALARQILGWRPGTCLDDGSTPVVCYFHTPFRTQGA